MSKNESFLSHKVLFQRIKKVTVLSIMICLLPNINSEKLTSHQKAVMSANRKNALIDLILHISSPLNLLPQVGLGLQSTNQWPIYGGVRVGASGNLITAGWYYAQATTYINFNLFQVETFNFYLGGNLTWRNHFLNTPIESEFGQDDPRYFSGFSTAFLKEFNYSGHLGFWRDVLYFEIGYEFSIFNKYSVKGPSIKGVQVNSTNLEKISDENSKVLSNLKNLGKYSKVYFSVGISIQLL